MRVTDEMVSAFCRQVRGHHELSVEEIRSGITAALAVDGVALVPKEPTEAMIIAGCENNPTQWNEGTDLDFAADVANDVYRAMVSAASEGEERRPPPKEKP